MAGYTEDMRAMRTSYEGKLHDLRVENSELAARATTAEASLAAMTAERDELRARDLSWSKTFERIKAEAAEDAKRLAASQARETAMREALSNASRFVLAYASSETDQELYASAMACEEQISAALQPQEPANE